MKLKDNELYLLEEYIRCAERGWVDSILGMKAVAVIAEKILDLHKASDDGKLAEPRKLDKE